ncbi:endothelin-converting enzyme 2, partial [Nephila pilipes]
MEKVLLTSTVVLLLLIIILFVISMVQIHKSDAEYCTTPACVRAAASIINDMDPSVNPCEDFYQFACGGWIKSNPLPEDKNQWERYDELTLTINHILKYVL